MLTYQNNILKVIFTKEISHSILIINNFFFKDIINATTLQKQNFYKSQNSTQCLFESYTSNIIDKDTRNRLLSPISIKNMPRNLSEQFAFIRNLKDCYSFSQRVNYNFTVYHSKMYTRCKKSCDYIVRYRTGSSHENFGAIKEFFE